MLLIKSQTFFIVFIFIKIVLFVTTFTVILSLEIMYVLTKFF